MIKYAANAMLATRISFMNDIATLCEIVDADVNMVQKGIGSDTRIGSKFLYAGAGYGGSCFPKDVKALIKTADSYGHSLEILKSVEKVNDKQKIVLFNKLNHYYKKDLKGKRIALLGLAFKPNTDDMREAPALSLIEKLNEASCTVYAYDPVAMEESKRKIGNAVIYCKDLYETLENADAMLLVTEWTEFRILDLKRVKSLMKNAAIFDGRNIYNALEMKNNGIEYFCIGKRIQ
jgi:UDPglucose 6-dehydrogenase